LRKSGHFSPEISVRIRTKFADCQISVRRSAWKNRRLHPRQKNALYKETGLLVRVQKLFFAIAVKTAVTASRDTALRRPRHLLISALTIFRN
jgi:hypothetical protein